MLTKEKKPSQLLFSNSLNEEFVEQNVIRLNVKTKWNVTDLPVCAYSKVIHIGNQRAIE